MGRVTVKGRPGDKQNKPEPIRLERTIDKVPYVTGFCGNGWHEGTKKISVVGTLLRACSGTYVIQGKTYHCRCDCHEAFRQIFAITGLTTQSSGSSDLIGSTWGSVGPVLLDDRTDTPEPSRIPVAGTTEPQPTVLRHIVRPSIPAADRFSPTKSGIRAKGQLEAEVAAAMLKFFAGANLDGSIMALTPDSARAMIKTEPAPSVGAIYSIFQRWSAQAYCELGTKPFCMLRPTEHGLRVLARWS